MDKADEITQLINIGFYHLAIVPKEDKLTRAEQGRLTAGYLDRKFNLSNVI